MLRYFTIYVLHQVWDSTQLPMRKFDKYLPYVPTQEQVLEFISTIPDLKTKAIVSRLYSSGLRVREVYNLRYEDISRKTMRIHIRHTKNREDRYAILSEKALKILTEYWFAYNKPRGWLFPRDTNKDKPIYPEYVSNKIHEHERRLGWEEKLTCHSFRHAFGTHLYENGTDLLTIKELLGHKSLNSTLIYVHLAANGTGRAVSPFDKMDGDNHD